MARGRGHRGAVADEAVAEAKVLERLSLDTSGGAAASVALEQERFVKFSLFVKRFAERFRKDALSLNSSFLQTCYG